VWDVISCANMHPRVSILNPGPGVGGHCIAVDPWFIYSAAPHLAPLIKTAREVNDAKPAFVARQVVEALRDVAEPRIACLGVTFKADVDDVRQSPAVDVIELVSRLVPTAELAVVDPHIKSLPSVLSGISDKWLGRPEEAIAWANCVLVLVDHRAFKRLPAARFDGKVLVDTRGLVATNRAGHRPSA